MAKLDLLGKNDQFGQKQLSELSRTDAFICRLANPESQFRQLVSALGNSIPLDYL